LATNEESVLPIYEYICTKCYHRFDKLVRSMSSTSEGEAVACPKCGHAKPDRQFSAFAVGAGETKSSSSGGGHGGGCGCCAAASSCPNAMVD
jgi:putative FmdB family regulatory protein